MSIVYATLPDRAPLAKAGFGRLLRYVRQRACLSQAGLGRLVGCDHSYISRLESGEREMPTHQVVLGIARACQLSEVESVALEALAGYLPVSISAREIVAYVGTYEDVEALIGGSGL